MASSAHSSSSTLTIRVSACHTCRSKKGPVLLSIQVIKQHWTAAGGLTITVETRMKVRDAQVWYRVENALARMDGQGRSRSCEVADALSDEDGASVSNKSIPGMALHNHAASSLRCPTSFLVWCSAAASEGPNPAPSGAAPGKPAPRSWLVKTAAGKLRQLADRTADSISRSAWICRMEIARLQNAYLH